VSAKAETEPPNYQLIYGWVIILHLCSTC